MLAIFLDIETTGLDSKIHKPIDLAFKILDASTGELKIAYQSIIKQTPENWALNDPISIEVNGYTFEEIATGKEPAMIAEEIVDIFAKLQVQRGKAVFICQNPAFDRGFFTQIIDVYTQESLNWPYHWLDFASMYWAYVSMDLKQRRVGFPEELSLSKNSIAEGRGLPIESSPHRAMNGVDHLILCYQTVVDFPNRHPRTCLKSS